jgi:uncharacterized membrane protein
VRQAEARRWRWMARCVTPAAAVAVTAKVSFNVAGLVYVVVRLCTVVGVFFYTHERAIAA